MISINVQFVGKFHTHIALKVKNKCIGKYTFPRRNTSISVGQTGYVY